MTQQRDDTLAGITGLVGEPSSQPFDTVKAAQNWARVFGGKNEPAPDLEQPPSALDAWLKAITPKA